MWGFGVLGLMEKLFTKFLLEITMEKLFTKILLEIVKKIFFKNLLTIPKNLRISFLSSEF